MKRHIRTPEYFESKQVNPDKWIIPPGWNLCRQTGRLHRESELLITFFDWLFPRQWLRDRRIFVEDADWLSESGYNEIMDILAEHDRFNDYVEAA